MKSKVNNSRRKYQRCRTDLKSHLITVYLSLKKAYKKLINTTKLKAWETFVADSTKHDPWGLVYKIAKNSLKQTQITELIGNGGSIISDRKQITNNIMETLFPNDTPEVDTNWHKWMRLYVKTAPNTDNDIYFTTEEVRHVEDCQNKSKAPGGDGITADIVQQINNIRPTFLTTIFNKCLKLSHFLKQWKHSIVKIIPKAGKKDYRNANSYRPISLLSVFASVAKITN